MTERLSNKCPCDECGKDKRCELSQEACENFIKWEDDCIKKLAEYETAEEEGRLFICPVRPYDDIYIIDQGIIIEASVDCYQVYVDNFYSMEVSYIKPGEEFYTEYDGTQLDMDNFGEIWFLTREEAEKALKEMKKQNAADQRTGNSRAS